MTKKTIDCPILYRKAEILELETREDGDDERTFEISFSSEEPYERFFGVEILGHEKGEVNLERIDSGRAPLLLDHIPSVDSQIGVVQKAWLAKGTARARIKFGLSSKADEVLNRVKDGELSSVSVGYRVHRMRLEEETEDQDTFRVVDWTPHEISVVAIPADGTVGFGRGKVDPETFTEVEIIRKDEKVMEPENQAAPVEQHRAAPAPQPAPQPEPVDTAKLERDAIAAERKRIDDITTVAEKHNCRHLVEDAIRNGTSAAEFNTAVLNSYGDQRDQVLEQQASIGLNQSEKKRYSFTKALAHAAGVRGVDAGFEIECSEAASDLQSSPAKGIVIPVDVLRHRDPVTDAQHRDLTAGTDTAGGHTVATDLLGASFIDILRKRAVVMRLGARTMMDLQGDIAIPRQTGAATAVWVAESGNVSESNQTFDQVTMTPKTLGTFTDISRKLLLQSSIDVEAFVRQDLASVVALEIDRAALYGSGASNQPTGVANQSGINTGTANFAAADPTYAEVVDCESVVAADNADIGTMAYAVDALMRGAFKTTEKASGTAQFIWEPGNTVNGHRCEVSNQIVDGDVFFANWDDLIIGMWSGLDVIADPITGALAGTFRIVVHQDIDIAVRHPESFCLNNDGA